MLEIVQKEHAVLRGHAQAVPVEKIGGEYIKNVLKEMKTALDAQDDGIAIAAPQINIPLRIFLVSKKIHKIEQEERDARVKTRAVKLPENSTSPDYEKKKDLVFINPEIIKLSKKKYWIPEGCLSVRWLYGKVFRSDKATIRAYNQNGERITRGASGLLAQVFQHETDHLNGILFIDVAKDLEEIRPEEMEKITHGK